MATSNDNLTAADFVPVDTGAKDFVPVKEPSIFQRAGQFYKDITANPRERLARFIESGGGPFSSVSPLWAGLFPSTASKQPTPPDKPSTPSRFAAGMIIPPTATEAAIEVAAPGIGKLGKFATSGPVGQAIKGGLVRGLAQAGVGAGSAALTGESPVAGAALGAGTSLVSEVLRGLHSHSQKDVLPKTPEGFKRAEERFAAPIDMSQPQPGNWLRAMVEDLPALQRHIRTYDDLLGLRSVVAGDRILKNSTLAKNIGEEIYSPLHTLLNVISPNMRFTFPYLMPGRFGRLSITDPTISEILPNIDEKILRRAGNLSPNEALTIIQQLKDAAFNPANTGAIRAAAKKFATRVEEDFVNALGRANRILPDIYRTARQQYSQLKGLQVIISRNASALFPGGSGGKAGLDPVAWAKVMREAEATLPERLWPRLYNSVSFGGLERGSGAVDIGHPHGEGRAYREVLPGMRLGFPVIQTHPKMEFPVLPSPKPLSVLFRSLPPAIISGATAATQEK